MTYKKAEKEITENLGQAFENSSIWVRRGKKGFKGTLDTGRMKTQFETGTSGGAFDPQARKILEDVVVGVSDVKDINRPVYGYLSDAKNSMADKAILKPYGDFNFRLKPKMKSVSSFTMGDSLDANFDILRAGIKSVNGEVVINKEVIKDLITVASPIEDPKIYSYNKLGRSKMQEAIKAKDINKINDSLYSYVETQIHGGVTLEDIDLIQIVDKPINRKMIKARKKVLDSYNIEVQWISEGDEYLDTANLFL